MNHFISFKCIFQSFKSGLTFPIFRLKSDRNSSQHSCAETASSIQNHPSASSTPVITASPPIDNIWERRAEERESAERERMVQKDMAQQVHLQQHFPAVGESGLWPYNALPFY